MRQPFLLACIAATALLTGSLAAQTETPSLTVALTFDDLPATSTAPPNTTRGQIIDSILATLKAQNLPPVYGFLNARTLEDTPEGPAILRHWIASGNLLGSHTFSHPDLESMSISAFEEDILKDEPALQHYAGPADWHYFRYPFLHEGETLAKHQAIQSFLKVHGYKIAEVSLDFEDYLWNEPYTRCLTQQRPEDVTALSDSYLAVAGQYIDIYRSLARRLYGHDIPYVLLLHVTAFDAKMLPDLIAQLRARGFTFITLSQALKDPAYTIDPAIGYPGGGPMQEALAVARKLPFPPAAKPNQWLENTCKAKTTAP